MFEECSKLTGQLVVPDARILRKSHPVKWIFMLLLTSLCCGIENVSARQEPLWELGVGLTSLHLPYYRGSNNSKTYTLPFPYVIYRGEFLNVDEEGLRSWLFRSDALRLDLSLALGVPVPSDQNGARQGMPDLDTTIEVGPSVEARFWHSASGKQDLWLRLPLRTTYSVNGVDLNHQGWTFSPYIEYSRNSHSVYPLEASIAVGPIFADNVYHDYYYGVTPGYATPERPAYQAQGGYSGSRITVILRKEFKDLWLTAFARVDSLDHAKFESSPLLETRHYRLAGLAITWIFGRSQQLVSASE